MGSFLGGFLLPLLLLTAALINWSLVSLADLLVFLFIQFNAHKIGFIFGRRFLVLWPIIIFSSLVILSQVTFLVIWSLEGYNWSLANAWWAKLIGFMTIQSWKSPSVIYFLVVQLLAIFVAAADIYWYRIGLVPRGDSCWVQFSSFVDRLGSHLRVASCLLLPAIQIIVGISHPSWVSLPFFIGSCVGLVDWSLTSNFLGLFRWWRPLQLYAGFIIFLVYAYQLPVGYPSMLKWVAKFIGLSKISSTSEWPEICSYVSLILFYIMLSCVKCDLEEMDFIMSTRESNLVEQLLPSKHSFFIRELRSGVRHTNVLLRRDVFRTFTINFFTYGFPVALVALSFWSFHFASLCAFGLLAYVGYIVYAFPSLFRLHRLNGLLLVFILFWAISTYIFNVAFTFLNRKIGKDMHVWEMVGLWHYPIPGFFLLAQFGLGILVALVNLVNNTVFLCSSGEDERSSNDNSSVREAGETKVLIVATIAWGLRKSSRAILLTLIFLVAMKPGLIHAVYVVFFLLYLLSHDVGRKMRQAMILLNEVHFALLYLLQINLVSDVLGREGSLCREILLQLGLLGRRDSTWEFLEIALLACFCSIHNHGFEMLFSFSAVVQHTPSPPVGFSILRAGLNKSVLLSVYTATSNNYCHDNPSHERKIASFLSSIGEKFLSMYRSCGTYIAFLTILLTVCFVKPNYISFGYLFLLLVWIIGRQLVERTKRRLWFPLKAYAITVFIFIYCMSSFSSFRIWLSRSIDLNFYLGYDSEASSLQNCWQSLAVMIVMQLYSYERRQSRYLSSDEPELLEYGAFIKRFLIWHCDKILFAALFYASISPISVFGLLYLLGLVVCATLPKASHIPSKLFLAYTGVIMTAEYLFQMWGEQAEMFPGQKHAHLSYFLGFRVFRPGFWGLELGLRGKVLVIAASTLQYNVFRWLERMPGSVLNKGKWDDPCPLFVSEEDDYYDDISSSNEKIKPSFDSGRSFVPQEVSDHISSSSFASGRAQVPHDASSKRENSECSSSKKSSFGFIWGSIKESHKWDKTRITSLRKERFEMQKIVFEIYMKFWMENLFYLFGLEITMISLLLTSFALLNSVSLFYVGLLAACILLDRGIIRKLWPIFVFLFASILILEYIAFWKNMMNSNWLMPSKADVHCHDCWRISNLYYKFCLNCWLGLTVDDSRMLFSYFVVFMLSSLKLRADRLSGFSLSSTYRKMMSQRKNTFVWRDLSFETKSMWTILDYLRLYCYCHLLDLVLALILITGTLEYDVLHLGYLAFALVFFRLRLEILKKKNKVFKFLRAYNFALIILSLAYQSPLVGEVSAGKCETMHYIFEMIGFYKYDYGFRITARSALVEIIIFMLVSLQSYMFSSQEFEYVCRYLEAEQIGAIVREQEKKAAWKTEQLQHIRASEESKRQRNLQVEKMKSEMLNLQIQLHNMNSSVDGNNASRSPGDDSVRKRSTSRIHDDAMTTDIEGTHGKVEQLELQESLANLRTEITTESRTQSMELPVADICEIDSQISDVSLDSDRKRKHKGSTKGNPLMSAVQFIGDGVSQVQSIGNQAVSNLATFLNVTQDDDMNEQTNTEDRVYDQIESQQPRYADLERSSSLQSDKSSDPASMQLGRIFRYIWSQMRSNNDVVCYCCFILVFLWNFSLLSMVYLAALFVYALCVNAGPGYMFWVVMLIYTELYILLQYLYQIIIQHCGLAISSDLLQELGFPTNRITSSFVVSSLPLFLVYLFTLLQRSITAKDGEWTYLNAFNKSALPRKHSLGRYGLTERAYEVVYVTRKMVMVMLRSSWKYWKSLTQGAESPPYFIQVSMDVQIWPEDGIQPERIESGINQLLRVIHEERCKKQNARLCPFSSRVHVQSIERSKENTEVALVVLEVEHSSSSSDTCSEWCDSLTPAADVANEIRLAQRNGFVENTGFPYRILSVIGGGKREIDLYAYVFGADLTVFFFVAIFYQSVIKNNSEFLDVYQLEDQFPKEFVFVLMIIFFLIVLDRCIYLCSFAIGKVIFYLFNLVLFTYAVTEYAWQMEPSNQHAGELALRAIFLAKAVSLALQAIQIRYGLPHKSTLYRQFLTSEVSRINYLGYRLYRALPFLYELRCVLDWSCTSTSLTMYDWLKLEDINASLYLVKCDAVLNRSQHKQGEKQTVMTKCCNGICLFFILLFVIWAPMLMYSSGNPTNVENPIKDASCQVDIKTTSGRLTLYQTTLCEKISWNNLNANLVLDPGGYLGPYNKNDIQLICCQADASVLWLVPGVVQSRFIHSLDRNQNISVSFTWILTRDRPKGKEVVQYDRVVDPRDLPNPSDVQKVLNGSMNGFRIKNVYQRYFRVTGSGDVRPLEQEPHGFTTRLLGRGFHTLIKDALFPSPTDVGFRNWYQRYVTGQSGQYLLAVDLGGYSSTHFYAFVRFYSNKGSNDHLQDSFVNADLILNRENYEWWSFHDVQPINVSECGRFTGPVAFVISEEIPPQGILGDTLSKFSIWGLYITFVLAVGRFIRLQCSDLRMRIPYENLPSCDRLIAICEDIYAARAEGELGVEEVLYWTLVKIYRSPHMLLEYTKID